MTEQDLKRLRKQDLLELLLAQDKEIENLEEALSRAEGMPGDHSGEASENERPPAGEEMEAERLEAELRRMKYRNRYLATLRSTVCALLVVAAVAVLVATIWLPTLRIYGSSMTPTLSNGEIVLTLKRSDFATGDVIAFYYNNKILIKRVIATSGDWVDIREDGTVYVNGTELDEPYVSEKSLGECDLAFPYQVPESRIFVMGDHRSVSVDSRSSTVGCVAEEQIVGRIIFRVWPFSEIGQVE